MTTRPTVEGVSDRSLYFQRNTAAENHREGLTTLMLSRDVVSIIDELLAARQQLAEMRGARFAWLIEKSDRGWPLWRSMTSFKPEAGWTNNAPEALQFSRKEDAEAFMAADCGDGEIYVAKAIEHGFHAALAPTSQPSRGKCETCNGERSVRNTREETKVVGEEWSDCPDCAQPSRELTAEELAMADKAFWASVKDHPATIATSGHLLMPKMDCAQPERQGDDDGADTGNAEADRVLRRLASSDPDFDDCIGAAVLIRRLVADMRGPDGFATWKDAAIAERLKRPSPPPTDDIVAGLRNIRERMIVRGDYGPDWHDVVDATTISLAIAALGEKGCDRKAVIQECWDAINKHIKTGPLPTTYETEQRNGMVLASNLVIQMLAPPVAGGK